MNDTPQEQIVQQTYNLLAAAQILKITPKGVQSAMTRKQLKGTKDKNNEWIFTRETLDAYIRDHQEGRYRSQAKGRESTTLQSETRTNEVYEPVVPTADISEHVLVTQSEKIQTLLETVLQSQHQITAQQGQILDRVNFTHEWMSQRVLQIVRQQQELQDQFTYLGTAISLLGQTLMKEQEARASAPLPSVSTTGKRDKKKKKDKKKGGKTEPILVELSTSESATEE